MKKKVQITSLFILMGASAFLFQNFSASGDTKPNVIYIMFDDLGFGQFEDSHIKTPFIKAFKRESVHFNRFYVHPMCTPTRASFLSGRNPLNYGLHRALGSSVGDPSKYRGVDMSKETVPSLLNSAGYTTFHVGKWHASGADSASHPEKSFDYFELLSLFGHQETKTKFRPKLTIFKNTIAGFNRSKTQGSRANGHTVKVESESVLSFLKSSKSKNKPFYINYWTYTPHSPFEDIPGFDYGYPKTGEGRQHNEITYFDEQLGKVLQTLKDEGLYDNTIVILTSDNGSINPISYNGNLNQVKFKGSGPLRGYKTDILEGGIRNHLYIRWPRGLEASVEGRTNSSYITSEDLLPTIAELTGLNLKGDSWTQGESFAHLMTPQHVRSKKHRSLTSYFMQTDMVVDYNNAPQEQPARNYTYAAISYPWKIVHRYGSTKLYNIHSDPEEKKPRTGLAKKDELKNEFLSWKMSVGHIPLKLNVNGAGTVKTGTKISFSSNASPKVYFKRNQDLKSFNYPTTFTATIMSTKSGKKQIITDLSGTWSLFINAKNNLIFELNEYDKNSDTSSWKTINAGKIETGKAYRVGFVTYPLYIGYAKAYVYKHKVYQDVKISSDSGSISYKRFRLIADSKNIYIGSNDKRQHHFYGYIDSSSFYRTHFTAKEMHNLYPPQKKISSPRRSCRFAGATIPHGSSFKAYKKRYKETINLCRNKTNSILKTCTDGNLSGSGSFKEVQCFEFGPNSPLCSLSIKSRVKRGADFNVTWETRGAEFAYLYPDIKKTKPYGSMKFTAPTSGDQIIIYLKANNPNGKVSCSKKITLY